METFHAGIEISLKYHPKGNNLQVGKFLLLLLAEAIKEYKNGTIKIPGQPVRQHQDPSGRL